MGSFLGLAPGFKDQFKMRPEPVTCHARRFTPHCLTPTVGQGPVPTAQSQQTEGAVLWHCNCFLCYASKTLLPMFPLLILPTMAWGFRRRSPDPPARRQRPRRHPQESSLELI